MKNHANYQIVEVTANIIFISDLDLGNKSITNDAEHVVDVLLQIYGPKRKIVYRDTEGQWDELKHDGEKFIDFAPYTGIYFPKII